MSECCGYARTEKSLTIALKRLEKLKRHTNDIRVDNYHELMRVNESQNLLRIAELMATAALARKESRVVPYHHRLDYPETDDENWLKLIVLRKKGNKIVVSFKNLSTEKE